MLYIEFCVTQDPKTNLSLILIECHIESQKVLQIYLAQNI